MPTDDGSAAPGWVEGWTLVRHPAEGLALIDRFGDLALWTRAKLRKTARCQITGEEMAVGTLAYRPMGNQQYRASRIAAEIIDILPVDGVRTMP